MKSPAVIGLVGLLSCGALLLATGCSKSAKPADAPASKPAAAPALAYQPLAIGAPVAPGERPLVTHLQVVDLDQDGLVDVIYCEAAANTVRWIRQAPRGVFTEQVLARDVPAPAHVAAADLNGSGRRDVLVACLGQLLPNNDRIGSVLVLENLDNESFKPRVLLEQTARVTDVRAADLTGHR